MIEPLALVFYRKLMPGSQLKNRLQDLNYRVHALSDSASLLTCAATEGPMLIFIGLDADPSLEVIVALRKGKVTQHIPIIMFGDESDERVQAARQAGATLVVGESALLPHLPGLLEQALRVE